MEERKPNGYLKDFGNVKRELELIIKEEGNFPSAGKLHRMSLGNIVHAIAYYHGGMNKVREKMGFKLSRKPPNHWKDVRKVIEGIKLIIKETGRFLTYDELQNRGFSGLLNAICDHHGGLNKIRQNIGYPLLHRPNNYWRNPRNLTKELNPVIKELGRFPTQKELCKRGLSTLSYAISRYYGGVIKLKGRMGYKANSRPPGYLKDFSNLMKELEPIISELGDLPTYTILRKRGLGSISLAITKYHGGFQKLREKMGYKQIRKSMGQLKNFENLVNELKSVITEITHFPTIKELEERGFKRIVHAITKYHGGIFEVRKKMGYEYVRKPLNYWKDLENVKKELEPLIKELGHFPTHKELKERGLSSITQAIIEYHGGTNRVIAFMGCSPNENRYHTISLEGGLEAYFRYMEKYKVKDKKHITLKNFFWRYDPKTLEPVEKGIGPLHKYAKRYYQEMKRLEGKV